MTEKSKLIDVILNDCTVNTVRQYRPDGSDAPKENPTADKIRVGYSLSGGSFGSLDVGKVIEEMLVRKLIFEKADHKLYTDKLGYDVLDMGGWEKYTDIIRKKDALVSFQHKWFWLAAFLSFASPVGSIIYQQWKDKQRTETIYDKEEQQLKKAKKNNCCNHKHIQQNHTKIEKADTSNSK